MFSMVVCSSMVSPLTTISGFCKNNKPTASPSASCRAAAATSRDGLRHLQCYLQQRTSTQMPEQAAAFRARIPPAAGL